MTETAEFLAGCRVFASVPASQMQEMAGLFRTAKYQAGSIIVRQGGYSPAVYVLKSGRLAVRVNRGGTRETIAVLQPQEIFGELSFLTGRVCVADVEVVVDAEVVYLPREAMPKITAQKEAVLQGLLAAVVHRLQTTVSRGTAAPELPVILLQSSPRWKAPSAFARDLAMSLAKESGRKTLLIEVGDRPEAIRDLDEQVAVCKIGRNARADLTKVLTEHEFDSVIVNAGPGESEQFAEEANVAGYLLGPGEALPEMPREKRHFVVQDARGPTLPFLGGGRQLIWDVERAEQDYHAGRARSSRFLRTVESMARYVCQTQVGLALGGGAAWGWAHIGVLAVLEEAGVPIDVICGCSMGCVVGSLRASGRTIRELTDIADYWRTRTARFVEWRLWKMCLLNESVVRKTFERYFGDLAVNRMEIPFWANAVDIEGGKEYAIRDGSVVECLRSSIALPGLLPPYPKHPELLVDAGIMDPVPARLAREMECNYVIAVNAMAAPGSTPLSEKYPLNAFHVMNRCMFLMGHEIGQARAEEAADLVFTPNLDGISMLQFRRSPEIIARGRAATEEHIAAIREGYQRLRSAMVETKSSAPVVK